MIFLLVCYTEYNKTHWQINEYETYARISPEDILSTIFIIFDIYDQTIYYALLLFSFLQFYDAQCYDKLYCDLYLVTTEQ